MRAPDFRHPRAGGSAAQAAPLTPAQRRYLAGARQLARWMDVKWGIGRLRFGLDTIIGLLFGVGDLAAGVASLYQMWVAIQLGVPVSKLLLMTVNIVVDLLFGLVPVGGDIADMFFKSHMRNLRIIEEHVRQMERDAVPIPVQRPRRVA